MTDKALARPPQVTMAAWVTIVGSAFVVVSVYDVVSNLRSLDTRERVRSSLDDPPFDGLGLGVQEVLEILHVVALVAGASAAAAAILGWYVLRRNRQARLALTVIAVPLFFAGMVSGGFLSSMVAVAAVLLWSRPARDWFDGRAPAREVRDGAPPTGGQPWHQPPMGPQPPSDPSSHPSGDPSAHRPGHAQPPSEPPGRPPVQSPGPPAPPYAGYGSAQAPRFSTVRPAEVLQACLVTWVFAGLVLTVSVVALLGILADPGLVQDAMESDPRYADAGISEDTLRTWVIVSAVALIVWSSAAILFAVFTFLGRNWARIGLIICAISAGTMTLVAVFASPLVVILAVACGMCVLLLTRRAASEWFTRRF